MTPTRPLLCTALFALAALTAACEDGNLTQPDDALAPYAGLDAEPLPCLPNLDGVIEAHELAPTLNQLASYRVTPPLPATSTSGYPVDVAGSIDATGGRLWDWSTADVTDQVADLLAEPLDDQWYAPHFPTDTFAVPTDAAGTLHGVYSHTDGGLLLHGVASATESPPEGKSLMVYESPIVFFPFPFEVGSAWTQTGKIRDGWARGLHPWSQDDLYEVSVEDVGELRLPDFTFTQALRVYTKVTLQPKTGTDSTVVQHQHSFVFECFGEVARASSPLVTAGAPDPGALFTTAHEIRRLGWF